MASWKYTLDVRALWKAHVEGQKTPPDVARELAKRLREMISENDVDNELENILEELDEIAQEEDSPDVIGRLDDCVLWDLYNWADDGHRLWLRTRF